MSAKVRAESDASSPRASTILLATPFQIAEGVASQNLAISVCSAVRVVLVSDPMALISL